MSWSRMESKRPFKAATMTNKYFTSSDSVQGQKTFCSHIRKTEFPSQYLACRKPCKQVGNPASLQFLLCLQSFSFRMTIILSFTSWQWQCTYLQCNNHRKGWIDISLNLRVIWKRQIRQYFL
jgi:hypothetical protein